MVSIFNNVQLNSISRITRLAGYEYSLYWQEDIDGTIIALRGFNIGKNSLMLDNIALISNKLSLKLKRSRLCKYDIVYPCVGTIGNAVVILEDNKYHIQQNIARIIPDLVLVDPSYLAHYLMSDFGLSEIKRFNGTSSQPNILVGSLRKYNILLPPLPEQRRIAAALTDTDALISALEKLIAKKRAIKQGAMQELLTGKRRLPGFSGEWVEKKLGDVTEVYDNLRIPVAESLREEGQTPYYGANGIQDYVKGHTHDGEFVLIAEDGANDLRNYPIQYVDGEIWVNNHAHVVKGISNVAVTKFLGYVLKVVDFQSVLVGGTRAKLNGSVMRSIDVLFPKETDEQTAIAEILSDMDAEIDKLTAKLNKLKNIKQGMMNELLTGRIRLIEEDTTNGEN